MSNWGGFPVYLTTTVTPNLETLKLGINVPQVAHFGGE
jgi:hypothetical protein